METSEFLAALREEDDRVLLETSTQRRGWPSAGPCGHQPGRVDRVWPRGLLPILVGADGNELLGLQYCTERYYSERIMSCDEPSSQDILLALAYLRVVDLQFLRGEPDMGFSARELAFVLAAVRRLPHERRSDPHILEIGCGAGNLLGSLAEHGILSLRGIDLAPEAVQRARERLRPWGLQDRVTRSTPENLGSNGDAGTFDLVLLCDVIEHVPPNRMGAFLAAVRRLLREDGLLVVVTPSALTGPHDVTRHFRPPGTTPQGLHLREYTLRGLTAMLREAGFGGLMGTDIISSILGLRPRLSSLSISVKMRLEGVLNATPRAVREQVVNRLYYAGVTARPVSNSVALP
ncbi:MAG: SAM-dependent methyltransferase [Pseudonocardiaceae bacterium]